MSANIPFEIVEEIIKSVIPVKYLLRFRAVSKRWKSFIDSSKFITYHHNVVKQNNPHHLLVRYKVNSECKYVSIVNDDSFPKHNQFYPVVSPTVECASMWDSSHGLVFMYGFAGDKDNRKKLVVVWNPFIRKSIGIVVPDGLLFVGFGVCPTTMHPKIVKITVDLKAEVFTLSTGVWRSILMNMPRKSYRPAPASKQVVVDGIIYWMTCDLLFEFTSSQIISFDLTNEEFGQVALPRSLSEPIVSIYKLKESLALLNYNEDTMVVDLWMMTKYGGDVKPSFTKLLHFDSKQLCSPVYYFQLIGFSMNGQHILEQVYINADENLGARLKAYDPCSKHISDLEIIADDVSRFEMTSYTESLLLLNQSSL